MISAGDGLSGAVFVTFVNKSSPSPSAPGSYSDSGLGSGSDSGSAIAAEFRSSKPN